MAAGGTGKGDVMRALSSDKGFTLLETVIATMMVVLMINGLLLLWQLAEAKSRGLDRFTQTKTALETAYEITLRSLRQYACNNITISEDNRRIQFRDATGVAWAFAKEDGDFKKIRGSEEEVLLAGICKEVYFAVSGRNVFFRIKATSSAAEADLTVQGTVYLRNRGGTP